MEDKSNSTRKDEYILVKDAQGNQYVCQIDALKKFDELSEKEKATCRGISSHGPGE